MSSDEENFVPAIDESELRDGTMKLVTVDGTPVLLVKVKGQIFAIDNRCPHMGCGFSGGSLDGYVIICPCHDWHFDLKTGEYEEEKEMKLVKYKLKIETGKICIKVDEDTE